MALRATAIPISRCRRRTCRSLLCLLHRAGPRAGAAAVLPHCRTGPSRGHHPFRMIFAAMWMTGRLPSGHRADQVSGPATVCGQPSVIISRGEGSAGLGARGTFPMAAGRSRRPAGGGGIRLLIRTDGDGGQSRSWQLRRLLRATFTTSSASPESTSRLAAASTRQRSQLARPMTSHMKPTPRTVQAKVRRLGWWAWASGRMSEVAR
jgi:hypothetical protein